MAALFCGNVRPKVTACTQASAHNNDKITLFISSEAAWRAVVFLATLAEEVVDEDEDENGRDAAAAEFPRGEAGDDSAQRSLHIVSSDQFACQQVECLNYRVRQKEGEVNRDRVLLVTSCA